VDKETGRKRAWVFFKRNIQTQTVIPIA